VLTAYLIALAFGGTLLGASIVVGSKDTDGSQGSDHHESHGTAGDALSWLPASSLRFWTFLLTFGGAIGTILTLLGSPASPVIVLCAALGVGWASGAGAVAAVRLLAAKSGDSSLSSGELVGTTGRLLLGAGPSEPGKVRIDIKGRIQDFVAISDEELPTGASVLVVATQPDGGVVVTKADET